MGLERIKLKSVYRQCVTTDRLFYRLQQTLSLNFGIYKHLKIKVLSNSQGKGDKRWKIGN